jgi:hypothetical protein
VSAVLLAEPELGVQSTPAGGRRGAVRWWQPVAGVAVAAGVAAVSILWLRAQAPLPGVAAGVPLTAAVQAPQGTVVVPAVIASATNASDSYVTPRASKARAAIVPSTELANYVVAHSMFSSPVARRNLLSAFMTSEPGAAGAEESQDDVKINAQ